MPLASSIAASMSGTASRSQIPNKRETISKTPHATLQRGYCSECTLLVQDRYSDLGRMQ